MNKIHRSPLTVSKHVQNVLPKLKANNAPGAVNNYLFRKYGLIDFD